MTSQTHNSEEQSTAEPPFISVIIPVYNGTDIIATCLDSLLQVDYPTDRFEIMVVDNNSADDTAAVVATYPGVILLHQTAIQSSYASRNEAIRQARGELLAFTDADCVIDRNWLRAAVKRMTETNADLVAGHVEMTYGDPPTAVEIYEKIIYLDQARGVEEGYGATANLIVRRSVFDQTGLFHEHMISSGDAEFGIRCKTAGFKLVYAREAIVYHPARDTLGALFKKAFRLGVGFAQHFFLKAYKGLWIFNIRLLFPQRAVFVHLFDAARYNGLHLSTMDKVKLSAIELGHRYCTYLGNWYGFWLHRDPARFFLTAAKNEPLTVVISPHVWDGKSLAGQPAFVADIERTAREQSVIFVNIHYPGDIFRSLSVLKKVIYKCRYSPVNLNIFIYNLVLKSRRRDDEPIANNDLDEIAGQVSQLLSDIGRQAHHLILPDAHYAPIAQELGVESTTYLNGDSVLNIKSSYLLN